jgi:hypothetical protein
MTNVLQSPNINLNIIIFEKLNSKKKKIAKIFQKYSKINGDLKRHGWFLLTWLDLYIVMDI